MEKHPVQADGAPKPIGPYNQAVVLADLVFTAGQIALDPLTRKVVGTDVKTQTARALDNLKALLDAAGSGLDNAVKTTVYLKDLGDFAAMNEVYARYFTGVYPARTTVEVSRLPLDVLVEIDCIAFK